MYIFVFNFQHIIFFRLKAKSRILNSRESGRTGERLCVGSRPSLARILCVLKIQYLPVLPMSPEFEMRLLALNFYIRISVNVTWTLFPLLVVTMLYLCKRWFLSHGFLLKVRLRIYKTSPWSGLIDVYYSFISYVFGRPEGVMKRLKSFSHLQII